ncbi:RagB/SusD family nutrient uptake outer membrane protein [Chitinophaga vietnamensis]|uniref:RagB/SusD family nutrient uptake outer membrane protein n=1 Tax=Chitinophaga vietnamensis TaxID=2593957 RepID=UPI0013757CD0|nr:RagB/SusD family nutrient uptake outer membrane protein [Chitinophaga vietnamensis]
MNRKIYPWLAAAFCMWIGLASCNKSILDKQPPMSYSDDVMWSDLRLVEAYVNARYWILPHFIDNSTKASTTGLSGASDEGYDHWNYENEFRFNLGQITPDYTGLDNWTDDYAYIRSCNIFFERISKVSGDTAWKNRLAGEMKFIRAWCYFDLMSRYGGVPLITKSYSITDTSFLVKRNTYDECLAFVSKELDDALPLLPYQYNDANTGRITKGAVLALKSRLWLYAASALHNPAGDKARWQQAADAAKAVIDLAAQGYYSLDQRADYKQIFLDKKTPESILSFGMNATYGDNYIDIYIYPNGSHGYSAYVPSQNMVDAFEMKSGKMITDAASGYDPAHPYDNRDPRFYANILYNGATFKGRTLEYFTGGMDSPQSSVDNWNASFTGYNWRKYADESNNNLDGGSGQNFIMFRLAEFYLNYAEASFELGNENTARQYLNLIRERASVHLPDITATGTALRDAIRHERQIELCFEGHRFYDVRRWKIAEVTDNLPLKRVSITKQSDGTFTYTYLTLQDRKFNLNNYLFPIPKDEMNKNNLLVQNPNY